MLRRSDLVASGLSLSYDTAFNRNKVSLQRVVEKVAYQMGGRLLDQNVPAKIEVPVLRTKDYCSGVVAAADDMLRKGRKAETAGMAFVQETLASYAGRELMSLLSLEDMRIF